MADNLVFQIVFSLIDLVKGTLFNFPLPFVLVLIGTFFRRLISEKLKLKSWMISSFISVYFMLSLILVLAYFVPVFFGLSESLIGLPPPGSGLSEIDLIASFLFHFFRLLLLGVVFSFVVMPFALFGSIVFSAVENKFKTHYLINLALGVFASMLVFFALWLFVFLGFERGVIYLIYFWMS
ncbi:MAG: hypothetical protein JW703_05540 [Candidatus Diapherotrites archaeon]|nr:hypothetical protein [Candidatus Diapherotrites archaeon]